MSVDSLSVAVIGGGMVGRSHANGYRQAATVFEPTLPPIRLAAIADVDADRARDVAQRYGYERAVTSWQEIADDPTIDVVSVGVGNDLHREVTEGLLAAGKHVLCEKPLAGNLEDAEAMVAAAAAHPELVTGTGYCYRRNPSFRMIKERVDAGDLGQIVDFTGHYWADYGCDLNVPMTWRYQGGLGSGALGDVGAHIIDLAEELCGHIVEISGARVDTVVTERRRAIGTTWGNNAAVLSDIAEPVDNEDLAVFTARFANGAIGSFSISRVAFGHPNGQAFTITGLNGQASFDWHRPAEIAYTDSQTPAAVAGIRPVIAGHNFPGFTAAVPTDFGASSYGYHDLFVWQNRAFLDQVAGTENPPLGPVASFEDGARTLRVITAVVESASKAGLAVTLEK